MNRESSVIKYLRNGLIVMLVLSISLGSFGTLHASAASAKWKRACKAYKTFLKKNESTFVAEEFDYYTENKENYKKSSSFALVDLDKNGIPELLTWHGVSWKNDMIYVFTYNTKSKKVVRYKDRSGKKISFSVNSQAQGWYEVFVCRKSHIHMNWNGGRDCDNAAYYMSSRRLKEYSRYEDISFAGIRAYSVKGKSTTAKKYRAAIRSCKVSNAKTFHENNAANRNKYLK